MSDKDEFLDDVLVLSAANAWAVGHRFGEVGGAFESRTHVLHWDGAAWTFIPSQDVESAPAYSSLYGLDGRGDVVLAVGASSPPRAPRQTLIERWTGSDFRIVPSPNPSPYGNSLEAVAMTAMDDAWAVGSSYGLSVSDPLVLRWNGVNWGSIAFAAPRFCAERTYLTDVAGLTQRDVIITGHCRSKAGHTQAFILALVGQTWQTVAGPGKIPADTELYGAAFVSETEAWAVGQRQVSSSEYDPLLMHFSGGKWTSVAPPATGQFASLKSVAANGPDDVWAVGVGDSSQPPFAGRLTMHWDGASWMLVPAGDFGSLWGVGIARSGAAWAVGAELGDSLILRSRK
jgi:hypothetical protein